MGYYRSYQSVSQRAAKSKREAKKLSKRLGRELRPAPPEGEGWGKTSWGRVWIEYIESFSDDSARASRGRSYANNGSVIDVERSSQGVFAQVVGAQVYTVELAFGNINVFEVELLKHTLLASDNARSELARGQPGEAVMALVMRQEPEGLLPARIHTGCTCYDWGEVCKHRLAVLYGLGGLLDQDPGLLFELRGVDFKALAQELFERTLNLEGPDWSKSAYKALDADDLSELFGVELIDEQVIEAQAPQLVAPALPPEPTPDPADEGGLSIEALVVIGFILKVPGLLEAQLKTLSGLSAKALKAALGELQGLELIESPGGKGYVLTDRGFNELWRFF